MNRRWKDPGVIVAILTLIFGTTLGVLTVFVTYYSSRTFTNTATATITAPIYPVGQFQTQTLPSNPTYCYGPYILFSTSMASFTFTSTQHIADPLTIFGLIGAGVGIALALIGIAWALLKKPQT